jgi:hypothetical protein
MSRGSRQPREQTPKERLFGETPYKRTVVRLVSKTGGDLCHTPALSTRHQTHLSHLCGHNLLQRIQSHLDVVSLWTEGGHAGVRSSPPCGQLRVPHIPGHDFKAGLAVQSQTRACTHRTHTHRTRTHTRRERTLKCKEAAEEADAEEATKVCRREGGGGGTTKT